VPHAVCVESRRARLLVVSTPGGFDKFFFDTGEPAATLAVPPPAAETPDLDALVAALADYGVTVVGPPPAPMAV
jgi:non-ribosomal peptide synthetase component F